MGGQSTKKPQEVVSGILPKGPSRGEPSRVQPEGEGLQQTQDQGLSPASALPLGPAKLPQQPFQLLSACPALPPSSAQL
jgi:hypothetical protein